MSQAAGVFLGRPHRGKSLVGFAPEEHRVRLLHLLDNEAHVVVANELALPPSAGKLADVARRLHHTVEGNELLNDDWSHLTPFDEPGSTWCLA